MGLSYVVIGGWSLGGIAAQIFLAMFGASVSHVVLIATTPPGKLVKTAEQLFYDTAGQSAASLEQYTTLFFEPKDEGSRAASKRSFDRIFARKSDVSPAVPADWAVAQGGTAPKNPRLRGVGTRENLDVVDVADLLAGVDVDKNGHWSLFSFRLPQCVSLRPGLNTRST